MADNPWWDIWPFMGKHCDKEECSECGKMSEFKHRTSCNTCGSSLMSTVSEKERVKRGESKRPRCPECDLKVREVKALESIAERLAEVVGFWMAGKMFGLGPRSEEE